MDLIPTQNTITAQDYFSREDMSLVLHRVKTDVKLIGLPLNHGTENAKVAKSLNFVPVNKRDIKVLDMRLLLHCIKKNCCYNYQGTKNTEVVNAEFTCQLMLP